MTLYLQGKYFQNENFIQIFSESNMHLYVQTYVIFSHYIWLSGFNLDKTSFQAPSALFLTFKSQIKWSESRSVMSNSLQHHGLAHGILQARILEWVALPFSRGSSQPRDCRQILYQLSHKESPRILECVAYAFSRGSSCSRNLTGVSCTAGRFFTNWASYQGSPL